MYVIFLANILHNAVPEVSYEKRRSGDQKNFFHLLFFQASAWRNAASFTLLRALATGAVSAASRPTARFTPYAVGTAALPTPARVSSRRTHATIFCFLYFIHT